MATEIKIPTVGESVTSGVIASWNVAEGDYVERDATVLEIETDKITMEIPAPVSGVLVRQGAAEGDEVDVGAVVGEIDESAEAPAGAPGQAASGPAAQAQPSSAPSAQADAPADTPPAPPARATVVEAPPPAASPAPSNGDVRATPLARKLASERGVDLGQVHGTGAGGRIREQDVLAWVQRGAAAASGPAAGTPSARGVVQERMSPLRQRIASRLVEAQQTAAMLTTFNEADMSAIMALRKQYKEPFAERHGIGLGFMSFFVKACVGGLRQFPLVNAYIAAGPDGKPVIEKHDYQDVAIAVASPKGLVVPVIRNAETLTFAEIESAIKDFGTRAREGKLDLDEMTGGTFTITNGGIFGSMMSTPILNPPQSAILGMHTIKNRPVEDPDHPGQIALRPMMYLALSYDHRIVDGAEAVSFLVAVKNAIEDPSRLMLEL